MVNMTDFHNNVQSSNVTKSIFTRQRELMSKYEGIEEKNGLLETHDVPVDIDSYKGQARLKNFAWRVTEELTEALEPLYDGSKVTSTSEAYSHIIEEFIDAVHFMTELMILSGIDPDEYPVYSLTEEEKVSDKGGFEREATLLYTLSVIEALGLAMNCLKNKPWKQTHVLTDKDKYIHYVVEAAVTLKSMLYSQFGLANNDLLNCYLNKADVNKFRQESGY